jgi:nitrogen fixation protein FixH
MRKMSIDTMKPVRPLTGKHVLAMFLAFFGVVIAVNMVMLRVATSSFSGLETDSAYRAGLAYNSQIEAARQQAALGWSVNAKVDGERVVIDIRDKNGIVIPGLEGDVVLAWPADRHLDRKGVIIPRESALYEAKLDKALPPGQWDVIVTLRKNGERVFLSKNRIILN